jgi:hypothetical protein
LNLSVLEEERDELGSAMVHAQAALAICERHGIGETRSRSSSAT